VYGHATATTGAPIGLFGDADSDAGIAVAGRAIGGATGVFGYSGPEVVLAAKAQTGVYGEALQSVDARGVWGRSGSGRGVYGQASSGQGVRGYASSGTAGYFSTSAPSSGTALRAIGRVRLDNCAGVAMIPAGANYKVITPGINLSSSSAVTATLMGQCRRLDDRFACHRRLCRRHVPHLPHRYRCVRRQGRLARLRVAGLAAPTARP
jgi:hypothetical protein